MNPKTLTVLVLLLLAVVGYVLVVHTGIFEAEPPEEPQTAGDVFSGEFGTIETLRIESADGEVRVLERDGDAWRIAQPVDAPADRYAVNRIARTMKELTWDRKLTADQADPDVTGLDGPRWTITATDDEGRTRELDVGNEEVLGAGTYVRSAGDEVAYVVAEDVAGRLDTPLGELRDKDLFAFKADDVAEVRVSGRQTYELLRSEGRWSVVDPLTARADGEGVRKLIRRLADLRVEEFPAVTADPASLGLTGETRRAQIEVWTPAAEEADLQTDTESATRPVERTRYALVLGRKTGEQVYARRVGQDEVFLLDAAVLEDLQPPLEDLRDPRVLDVTAGGVVALETELPEGGAAVERTDGAWRMVRPYEAPADDEAVSGVVEAAATLEAVEYPDDSLPLAVYKLDDPRAKVTLRVRGRESADVLLIGGTSPAGEVTFVRTAASSIVYAVRTRDAEKLQAGPETFWTKTLVELSAGERVETVRIDRPGGVVAIERDAGAWSVDGVPADDENVRKLLDVLKGLTAERIVALGDRLPAEYADAKGRLVVEMDISGPAPRTRPTTAPAARADTAPATSPDTRPATAPARVRRTVRVAFARMADAVYAWRPDADPVAVGQVPAAAHEAPTAEFQDRTVLDVAPADVEIFAVRGEAALALARTDEGWEYVRDEYVPIDGGKVTEYLTRLGNLKAERFVKASGATTRPAVAFGVDLTLSDGGSAHVEVLDAGPSPAERYARAWREPPGATRPADRPSPRTFVLPADVADKLVRMLDYFRE